MSMFFVVCNDKMYLVDKVDYSFKAERKIYFDIVKPSGEKVEKIFSFNAEKQVSIYGDKMDFKYTDYYCMDSWEDYRPIVYHERNFKTGKIESYFIDNGKKVFAIDYDLPL